MAPEVVLGDADTDHRVDLYALGCVAYWLLTGKMVFEGENAMQVMIQHAQAAPQRPSLRVEWPIPAALEDLVMGCLEKDPARRPPSAEVVSDRLDAVPLTSAWTAERAEQWWAMHRPPAAGRAPCGGCTPVARGPRAAHRAPGAVPGLARPTTRTPRITRSRTRSRSGFARPSLTPPPPFVRLPRCPLRISS